MEFKGTKLHESFYERVNACFINEENSTISNALIREFSISETETLLELLVEKLRNPIEHYSDCSLHNEPLKESKECNCETL